MSNTMRSCQLLHKAEWWQKLLRDSLGLQTLGTYQSDHVAPPSAVLQLLNGSGYQQALGQNPYYAPQSFQYTLPDIFFQLDALGESADACSATESLSQTSPEPGDGCLGHRNPWHAIGTLLHAKAALSFFVAVTRHTFELLLCTGAGIRQFHFNAWKDPNGTLAAHPAGLKLAGASNVTLDPKYSYFGTWPIS